MEGNMRVPGSLPFQGRIVHQQTVHGAGGDAEIKPRPAELEEVRIPLPVRAPDDSDLVAFGIEHARNDAGRRKRVVDIGLAAHDDDVEITAGCGDHGLLEAGYYSKKGRPPFGTAPVLIGCRSKLALLQLDVAAERGHLEHRPSSVHGTAQLLGRDLAHDLDLEIALDPAAEGLGLEIEGRIGRYVERHVPAVRLEAVVALFADAAAIQDLAAQGLDPHGCGLRDLDQFDVAADRLGLDRTLD